MADNDVVLTIAEIKEENQERIKDLYETIRERKSEATDGLAELGVLSESAFVAEIDGKSYLLTYIKSEDISETQEQYQHSERDLDVKHREVLEQSLVEAPEEVTPLFHADVDHSESSSTE